MKARDPCPGDEDLGCCPKCESKDYWVLEGIQQFNPMGGRNPGVVIEIAGQLKSFRLMTCAYCYDNEGIKSAPWYRERASCRCALCDFEWDWMDDSIRKCERGNEL